MSYRTALITGASSGIGASLARRLAADGVELVLCARRQAELDRVAASIRDAGGRAHVRAVDVSDTNEIVRVVRAVDAELGGLDLVVANAGIGGMVPLERLSWESIEPMVRVNFDAAVATLTAVLPLMLERRRGHVVGVSSIAGYAALPRSSMYCATKAGLAMFLEALRLDLIGTGVNATVINPGFVRTPMTDLNEFPMPFMVEVDDAADLIVRRLAKAPAIIDFPVPLVAAMRLLRILPRPLVEMGVRRQRMV
jgi:short-subunit dehydrogenase